MKIFSFLKQSMKDFIVFLTSRFLISFQIPLSFLSVNIIRRTDFFFLCNKESEFVQALKFAEKLDEERVSFVLCGGLIGRHDLEVPGYKFFYCHSFESLEIIFSRSVRRFLSIINPSTEKPSCRIINTLAYLRHANPKEFLAYLFENEIENSTSAPVTPLLRISTNLPSISVIVTSFNASEDIIGCLNSLKMCRYDNLEIVVVDDCSSDDTFEKVTEFQKNNGQLKVVIHKNEKNTGTYVCRNIGINLATSDWITFQDSDDISTPTRFHDFAFSINNSSSSKVAFMGFYRRIFSNQWPAIIDGVFNLKGLITLTVNKSWMLENIGYFDSVRTLGDSEFYKRLHIVAGETRIGKVYNCLYLATIRGNSLSSKTFIKNKNNTYTKSNSLFPDRMRYIESFTEWHKKNKKLYIPFPIMKREFEAPSTIVS